MRPFDFLLPFRCNGDRQHNRHDKLLQIFQAMAAQLGYIDCCAVFLTVEIVEGQKICHVVIASELEQQNETIWSVLSSCLGLILSDDQFPKTSLKASNPARSFRLKKQMWSFCRQWHCYAEWDSHEFAILLTLS